MDIETIAKNSLVNCHCVGVDSIVLTKNPMTRVFIANNNHELWKNRLPLQDKMSVALHAHHCDLTLTPLYGTIFNIVTSSTGYAIQNLHEFKFVSAILNEKGKFESNNRSCYFQLQDNLLSKPVKMLSNEKHSMWVPKGTGAAWLVEEGAEDTEYDKSCWSNTDLTKFDFDVLYQPMSVAKLEEHLFNLPHWVSSLSGL